MGNWVQRSVLAVVIVLAAVCTGGGCQMDQQQRLALLEQAVTVAQEKVGQADKQIAFLQTQLATARAVWDNPALPADQRQGVQATIDKLSGALTQAIDYRKVVEQVLAETKQSVEQARANPTSGSELDIAGQIIRSVTAVLGPQAAAWGTLATVVLSVIGAAFQRKKAVAATAVAVDAQGEAAKLRATGKAIVQAVETLPPKEKGAVKSAVGDKMTSMAAKTAGLSYEELNAVVDELKAA